MDTHMSEDFVFQQSISVHQGSVRAVGTHFCGDVLMSGSMDKTNKLFNLNAAGKYEFCKEMGYHEGFVISVVPMVNGLGFFSGGRDNKIMMIDLEGNPVKEFIGHEGAVNSLSQVIEGELVSGSWDGTAKVWDVESGLVKHTLAGHTHAVSVLALQDGTIITGSQDKMIRIWRDGKQVKEFKGHEDIVRGFVSVPQLHAFASCSNDETVKLWALDGTSLLDMKGHQGFVFGIDCLETGEIVTGGDDCTVKVWEGGECKQTIQMPRTVWSITHNKLGDLIIGCEDKSIKTFTRDQSRKDTGADFKAYEEECKKGAQSQGPDMSTLLEFSTQVLGKLKGTKQGEIKVFKDKGVAKAYMWKMEDSKWEEIGEVVTGNSESSNMGAVSVTKHFPGDALFPAGEYDHIFDVELGDGLMRKLPFNNGANPYQAADKFMSREGLGRANVEQIVQFLRTHALSYKTRDFDGSEALAKVAQSSKKQCPKTVPQRQHLFFDSINTAGPKKKILEFEDEFKKLQYPVQFEMLISILSQPVSYNSQDIGVQQHETMKQLLDFQVSKVYPCIDLYRMYLLHPTSSAEFTKSDMGAHQVSLMLKFLNAKDAPNAVYMLTLRSLCNFFKNQSSNHVALFRRAQIFDAISPFLFSQDKNTRMACTTLFLNYTVDFLIKDDAEGRVQALSAFADAFKKETDLQTAVRMAITIANLVFDNDEAFDMLATLDFKRPSVKDLKAADGEKDTDKSRQSIQEICDWLNI